MQAIKTPFTREHCSPVFIVCGVLVFARTDFAGRVVLVEESETEARVWLVLHSDRGPFLFGAWYRAPDPGSTAGVDTFREELQRHREETLGTLVVGDFNVHQRKWLVHSAGNTPEGVALQETCREEGLRQLVREPTRNNYLLDLVLTDQAEVLCQVLPGVSDHSLVAATWVLPMPKEEVVPREVWNFAKANWTSLKQALQDTDWSNLQELGADEGATFFNDTLLKTLAEHVPKRVVQERKRTHPWLTDEVLALVKAKHAARGTTAETVAAVACSTGTLKAYTEYVQRVKRELAELPAGSRNWWRKSTELLELKGKNCSVPALKDKAGSWKTLAKEKADLLADTFTEKYVLPLAEQNTYSALTTTALATTDLTTPPARSEWRLPTLEQAEKTLRALRPEAATGPDLVPTRVLQKCSAELAQPLLTLVTRALHTGRWPALWVLHWIPPLYKKKAPWAPNNYRGIHLTSQVVKTAEMLLRHSF